MCQPLPPRRHADHTNLGRERQRQHGAGGFQGGFGKGVAEKIGVLVPELLVQQVDDGALDVDFAACNAREQMGVQRLGQQHGRAGIGVQVLVQGGEAKTGGAVVLKGGGVVDHRIHPAHARHHRRQQAAHGSLIAQISMKSGRARRNA
jgi:hypothetical protein